MSEGNQSENQSQELSDNQTSPSYENTPPKLQAVETSPKPEPSYGVEKSNETYPDLERGIETLPKPEPSYGIIDEGRFWSLPKRTQNVTNA